MTDPAIFTLFEQILPLILPVLVTGLVTIFKRLPKWVVPTLIVPGLGMAGQAIAAAASSGEVDPVRGLVLGALAVFVREVSNKLATGARALKYGRSFPRMDDAGLRAVKAQAMYQAMYQDFNDEMLAGILKGQVGDKKTGRDR